MALSPRFEDALVFATRLHAAQTRKGTMIPYVAHLLGTASIALEHGAGEEEAIAALLHDAVEDAPGDPADVKHEIRRRYGQAVIEIVCGCTDTEERPKPPWKPRKQAYIAHLIGASPSVRLVSAADKLYNARAILSDCRQIGEALWGRFTGRKEGTLWYYRALVPVFVSTGPQRIGEELDRVVSEIERLAAASAQGSRPQSP